MRRKGDLRMKITDHHLIKSGEQELIDTITADLDWGAIEEIFRKEHKLKIEENVEYKNGDIVVYNDQVAYKLEFDVKVIISVLLDREGNYLSVTSSGDLSELQDKTEDGLLNEEEKSKKESKDSYEAALSELDNTITSDNDDLNATTSNATTPQEKISKMASQAGDMISKIDGEG